jgi:hypothetical protein
VEKEEPSLERITELRQRVFDSSGWKIRAEVATLNRTHEAFGGNHAELVKRLQAHTETDAILRLWDRSHPERLNSFLAEVDRLLQNFLASATSLRDHQRRLRALTGDAAGEEYDLRTRRHFGIVGPFVSDLRNYTLHRRLPVTRGHWGLVPGGAVEFHVALSRSTLLKWDRWSASSKRFLAANGDVRLEPVVDRYFRGATAFHKWFEWALLTANWDDIEESNRLIAELNAYLPPELRRAS